MTEIQKLYLAARGGNRRGHYAALRHVGRQVNLDPETVGRCVDRAREADAIDERRARRKARKSRRAAA